MTINIPDCGEYRDARGRTPVDPAIFRQPHSLILGCAGQSMLANYAKLTPYHPATGGVYELCTRTGSIYQVTDGSFPTMGMDGGSGAWAGRLSVLPYWADMLVMQGKAKRVLLAAHNIGGTNAQRWCPVGDLFQRSLGTLQWLSSLGIPPNYWIEMLGQQDLAIGTTKDNFADLMNWKWVALKASGLTCPIVIGRGCHWTGYSDVNPARAAAIVAGQYAAAVKFGCSAGPNDDEWPDAYRADGVHPADIMRYWQLQRWLPAFPIF